MKFSKDPICPSFIIFSTSSETTSTRNLKNPCDNPMIKKLFRTKIPSHWDIPEKETVYEIIFRTLKSRNRLMLELMARGGMRIGEVLKLTLKDIQDRKLILREPKSGKEREFVFITTQNCILCKSEPIKAT